MAKFGDVLTTSDVDTGGPPATPPMCKVVRSADISVPSSASEFLVDFGTGSATEEFKTVTAMHDMAANPSRLSCTRTGVWIAKGQIYLIADGGAAGNPTFLVLSITTPSTTQTVKSQLWKYSGGGNDYWACLDRMFVVPSDVNTYATLSVINQSGVTGTLKAGLTWLSIRRMVKLLESDP